MKFPIDLLPYLKGEKFSNGLDFTISTPESSILGRFSYLENLARGKNIIHLGCCDHLPLIDEKIRRNSWMHGRLVSKAKYCLGIDIDPVSVDYVKTKLGYQDLICKDIVNEDVAEITAQHWDYLILGEILEHIDDPVAFLRTIREKYGKNIEAIVITVPNTFLWANHRNVLRHKEIINSDHKYSFTPYTLAKILSIAGYTVQEFYFTQDFHFRSAWRRRFKFLYYLKHFRTYLFLRWYPGLRENLVVSAIF
ncbi:MAG: methyltransferase domain-containing protein [Bacteroidales bacterium]